MDDPADWLARVHHDLVKRLLWPARDRRDLGGAPEAGELVPHLVDDEGRPIAPRALWRSLIDQAPAGTPAPVLATFGRSVAAAEEAAARGDVHGVLALEPAFAALARDMKGGG